MDPVTKGVVGNNPTTLTLAAAASVFLSLPYLCPYTPEEAALSARQE